MLVLSRSKRESIVFPSLGITVQIIGVSGSHVRLGIEAPANVPVHRNEVAERIFREALRHENPR